MPPLRGSRNGEPRKCAARAERRDPPGDRRGLDYVGIRVAIVEAAVVAQALALAWDTFQMAVCEVGMWDAPVARAEVRPADSGQVILSYV